jgi:hypothetical protein
MLGDNDGRMSSAAVDLQFISIRARESLIALSTSGWKSLGKMGALAPSTGRCSTYLPLSGSQLLPRDIIFKCILPPSR